MKLKSNYSTYSISRILLNIIFLLIALTGKIIFAQTANHLVISEILIDGVFESDASTNDEFVEIYNPTANPIDVSNWTIDYRSASSTTFNTKYTFPAGTIIQSHKYFLFGGGGVLNRDNNTESLLLGLSNTGAGLFLRNSSSTTIDLIGWGTAISTNFEGTVAVKPPQGVSLERKANLSSTSISMAIGGIDEAEGNGYDSNNNSNDFVQRITPQPQNSSSQAEPPIDTGGNGTGTSSISPSWVNTSESTQITIKIIGDEINLLDSILVVIPTAPGWTWSGNLSDINLSGSAASSPSLAVLSDTIYIGSVIVSDNDSLIITVNNLLSPSTAGYTDFKIKTAVFGGAHS